MKALSVFVFGAFLLASSTALAKRVCSDMDGDGIAETCIEISDGNASFPGSPPPTVPPVGPGKCVSNC